MNWLPFEPAERDNLGRFKRGGAEAKAEPKAKRRKKKNKDGEEEIVEEHERADLGKGGPDDDDPGESGALSGHKDLHSMACLGWLLQCVL